MEAEQVKSLIITGIPDAQVNVEGNGGKYRAVVVSIAFNNLNRVQRHQMIYATVQEQLQNGLLHALSIEALTPDEVKNQ